jgi:nicotinate-nucleotide adenylyltransferase
VPATPDPPPFPHQEGGRGEGGPGPHLGVFGGTFDPPHYGHLAIAEEAAEQLGLPSVLWVPTGQPPHKPSAPVSPAAHRVRMAALAIADNPRFRLSCVDVERPGPSYTVDLLALLHAEHGAATELYFVCGMDMLASFLTWHEPAGIIAQCQLVAITRPGYPPVDVTALETALPAARGRVHLLRAPGLDVSGTELRARVAAGRSVRYLVPPAVAAYIAEQGLYGAGKA